MIKKLLCVAPHLSTGGCPQFLVKRIEILKKDYDVHVVEWVNQTGGVLVVQRNRILNLIPKSNFHSINENGNELVKIIKKIRPEVVHFEELPETFISRDILNKIYSKDRKYKIVETTHDSSFPVFTKTFLPDKFLFVSAYNAFKYINLEIPFEIIEYPVEPKIKNRESCRKKLNFDEDYKHVLNVGLFTQRKNQSYLFEIAKKLQDYKIKFHFLGNQADNFKYYWEPLMKNKPDNCLVWGERTDVQDFIQASDLFFFASKGDRNNKELNPIAIKEALEYDVPMMMFNLDVYCGKYDKNPNITFLTGDLDEDCNLLLKHFKLTKKIQKQEECIIISTYPDTTARKKLTKECIESFKKTGRKIILASHYPVSEDIQNLVDYYIYDANNIMIHHSYYNRFWNYNDEYEVDMNISGLTKGNQSFAAYTNLLNSFKLAKQLGFKKALFAVYDVILHADDLSKVEEIFNKIDFVNWHAYLTRIHTEIGIGIETTAMGFEIDYFLRTFPEIYDPQEFTKDCERRGCQNFLEHYFMSILREEVGLWIDPGVTPLVNSGLGKSSNAEYVSILPIDETDELMFYFYTYNIDDRELHLKIYEEEQEIGNYTQKIGIPIKSRVYAGDHSTPSETREFKKIIKFNGKPIKINFDRLDDGSIYKSQTFYITKENIAEYKNNGTFKWKKKQEKPKIKLIHLQTTLNDEREQLSRESLSGLEELNYKLIQNEPYKELPPVENCVRPHCVSLEKFEQGHPLQDQALTPAHYGCYKSFKDGILNEFDEDLDFLIVCEGDCLLEVSKQEFIDKVYQACEIIKKHNIDYISFGDTLTLEQGWHQSNVVQEIPGQDLIFITDKIIGIQCIMFPKHIRPYLFDRFKNHPWEAADIFFNMILCGENKKMGILKKRITTQADGYSLIDRSFKKFRK